jgi:hypothetical protein
MERPLSPIASARRSVMWSSDTGNRQGAARQLLPRSRASHRRQGLPFVYGGATSEGFSRQRPAYQPNNYGDRWAPVLIAWVTRIQDPDLGADALGAGGSASVEVPNGQRAYVTGDMELNAEKLARILEQPNGKQVVQAVVMHELGHIMGLAHVNSRSQLMYPRNQSGVTDFGAGDLTGLAALGKGTCSSYR